MKYKIIVLIFFSIFIKISATEQEPDRIKIDGTEYDLLNNPFEKYLEKNIDVYNKLDKLKIDKDGNKQISTGNYRGYIATYELKDSILYLVELVIPDPNSDFEKNISVFKQIFGEKKLINLNYTGILEIPIGKLIESYNFGYSSLYESYKLVTIKNDNVEKLKELSRQDYQNFKLKQFKEFQKTDEYKRRIIEQRKISRENLIPDEMWSNTSDSEKEILKLSFPKKGKKARKENENFIFLMGNFDFIIVDY
ncbi:hypothetical protein [Bergeyella sp. RCAD1439]|uniref:hypothetical protein n=1 Tax=Bergeyella anatis TaxID=3113737 RepID=UPI002E178B81|nr:hypothetical protein [Bergeyella sp. RCAD1439]